MGEIIYSFDGGSLQFLLNAMISLSALQDGIRGASGIHLAVAKKFGPGFPCNCHRCKAFAVLCDSLPLTPAPTSADNTSHLPQTLSLGFGYSDQARSSSFLSTVVFRFLNNSVLFIRKAVLLKPSFPTTSP